MSVPFSSDEFLLKRSLFSSIFGVANRLKQAKTATAAAGTLSTAAEQQFFADESRQSCSSCQILDQQREVDHLYVHNGSSSSTNQTSARSPTTQLGQQFSDQLKFAAEGALNDDDDKEQRQKGDNGSDKTSNGLISREQIYAEIVRECNELEKQQKTKKNTQHNQQQDEHHREEEEEEQQNKIMMEVLKQSKNSELLLANKFLSCNDHLTARNDGRFSLDLERLIKVVVAHVLKEMNSSNKTPISAVDGVPLPRKQKRLATQQQQFECESGTMHGENAAQILERKREQNNAAAARYRQRQREQKDLLVKEICQLEQKNEKLKADIAKTQQEIEQEKAELWRRWHN